MSKVVQEIGIAAIEIGLSFIIPGSTPFLKALDAALLGAGIATTAAVALNALAGTPSFGERQAASAALTLGEQPREAIFGRDVVGGSLLDAFNYGGQYGTDWEVLVIALADHRCEQLVGFYVNDSYVTFAGDGAVSGYNGQLEVYCRLGTVGQTVPAVLTTYGGWSANDRVRGVTYVVVAYKADAQDAASPIWTAGRPRFRWDVKGLRCYDPRLDTTVGGSGSHRRGDPSTWAWTENAEICRYNFDLGIYDEDAVADPNALLIGRGLSIAETDLTSVFAAANVCDETVALAAGGTEKRYRVGGTVLSTEVYADVENVFAAAMGGIVIQPQGAVQVKPGHGESSVFSFTDDDIVVGTVTSFSELRSEADREWLNTVVPTYVEPAQAWSTHAAPIRRNTADVTADGGSREDQLNLRLVRSGTQAQRIAEIRRRMGRLTATGSVTLGPPFCEVEEGDIGTWTSARRFAGAPRTFRVERATLDEKWRNTLVLREITTECFDWTTADQIADGASANANNPPAAWGQPPAGDWTATGGTVASGTSSIPALLLTGSVSDPHCIGVLFEYAVHGSGVWTALPVVDPGATRQLIAPVSGDTSYDIGVTYFYDNGRGTRRTLGPVMAGSLLIDWNSNLSNIPYATITNNDDASALGYNGSFEDWPSGQSYPTGWSLWANSGGSNNKDTSITRLGKYSIRMDCNGTGDVGIQRLVSFPSALPAGTFLAGAVDMYLSSVVSSLPLAYIRLYTNAGLTTYRDTPVYPSATTALWQTIQWTARVNAGEQIYGMRIYLMGAWSSAVGGRFTGTVYFDRLTFALFNGSIDNTTITLNSDGTASGGPTGQITITGLGYNGDLNATRNGVFYSATEPASPYDGMLWVDTSVTPNVFKIRQGGVWRVSANNSTEPGGTGVNHCNPRYAVFAEAALPPVSNVTNGTVTLDITTGYFGGQSLKLSATAADCYVGLTDSSLFASGGDNFVIAPNRKWIISAYVKASGASRSGQLWLYTYDAAGNRTAYSVNFTTSATAGAWTRVSGILDLTADANTKAAMRVDNDGGAGGDMWFDGLMIEPMVGATTTPSPFVAPPNFLTTYTGDLDATRNNPRGTYNATYSYAPGDMVNWAVADGGDGNGYVRYGTGNTVGIAPSDTSKWTKLVERGAQGVAGLNTIVVPLYQRAASAPAVPSTTSTYTFSTKALTGFNNGWSTTPPAANGNPLYAIYATASSITDTDTIAAGEWTPPQVLVLDGTDGTNGTNGVNTATVFLFKRAAASPAVPSTTATYTFATGALTGQNNGWTQAVPANDGNPLWVITATAAASTATDTIPTSEWATPQVQAQDGATGSAGLNAMTVDATPGSITVLCDFNGTPKTGETSKTSQLFVAVGATDETSSASYAAGTPVGCTASVSVAGLVTLSAFTADSGYVDVTISLAGSANVVKRVGFQKQYDGAPGVSASTALSVADNAVWNDSTAVMELPVSTGGTISASSRWSEQIDNGDARSGGLRIMYREKGTTTWTTLVTDEQAAPAGEPLIIAASGSFSNTLGTTIYEFKAQTYRSGVFLYTIKTKDLAAGWAP